MAVDGISVKVAENVAEKQPIARKSDYAFTVEPLRRVMKQAGAPRVSDDAARALANALEAKATALVIEAAKIASHSNRRTVLSEDVKLAKKVIETM